MRQGSKPIAILLGILLLIVVFAPVPGHSRFIDTVHNAAHGPIFGSIAVLVLLWLRARSASTHTPVLRQYALALAASVAFGLATEIAQGLTNRDASWMDLRNDTLGALAFLLIFFAFDRRVPSRTRWGTVVPALTVGLVLCAFLAAPIARSAWKYRERNRQFPTLADFTHSYDRYFIRQRYATVEAAEMPSALANAAGETAMRVRLTAQIYPGIEFVEPYPDWTAHSTLLLDLTNPGPKDLVLRLRVNDEGHTEELTDRFNRYLTLRAGAREVFRVDLEDVRRAPRGRLMNLGAIASMTLFSPEPVDADFLVSRAWLE
jgi:hypothetical protein